MRNTYFVTCPLCGSNLDPGERCDCEERTVREMTPSEKAKETRKQHEEVRKAKDREKIQIWEKMKDACLHVLDDPSASSADKIKAVEILHGLTKGR